MGFPSRRFSIGLLFVALLSTAAFADRDLTQFGHDISVGPDEQVGEVVCFGCNVRIRGHVTSDVTIFGGRMVLEENGEIGGDVAVFGGDLRLGRGTQVGGDAAIFGGHIQRDPTAIVGGDVANFAGTYWLFLIFVLPLIVFGAVVALVIWLIRRLLRGPALPATA